MPAIKKRETSEWIKAVAATYGKRIGEIAYIFCSDEKILEVNRQYLQHDYYTDIITFDYCEGDRLAGDLFISLETVATNAEQFGASYEQELNRTIIHGILHLCGINDKGPGEREIMEAAEDKAFRGLSLRNSRESRSWGEHQTMSREDIAVIETIVRQSWYLTTDLQQMKFGSWISVDQEQALDLLSMIPDRLPVHPKPLPVATDNVPIYDQEPFDD
ncbi:rRNA maturation RNase YbeY [Streptococcus pneumoniae]|uniref:rRNA maturation RNase YbeY n=1 Tax=Streptococcus pneumoniae TaxID=1313 RepID=UPI000A8830A4